MRLGPTILVVAGCSGVGKSATMRMLACLNRRFAQVMPFITSKLRPHEMDKIHVTESRLARLEMQGALLQVNSLYGARYGTPLEPFLRWQDRGLIPMLDWPIQWVAELQRRFAGRVFSVYIEPTSAAVLQQRLVADGRDADGRRLQAAVAELRLLKAGSFDGLIDLHLVARDGAIDNLARTVQNAFLRAAGRQ